MTSALQRLQALLPEHNVDAFLVASPETLSAINLRYLSGFTGSSAYLLISRHHAWLLTDFRYVEQAQAECPDYEVVRIGPVGKTIAGLVTEHQLWRVGFESDKVPVKLWEDWQRVVPAVWTRMPGVIEPLRIKKDAREIENIRRAATIAGEALESILPGIAGKSEEQVALELEWGMRQRGAMLGFSTIVASGPRGSLPHGHPTGRIIQSGELVTIDFGAEYHGYKSDETITVAVGEVSEELRHLYDIVHQAQAAGIAAARPGANSCVVDRAARQIIEDAGYGQYFGHGTGHGVGLEVHENPYTTLTADQGVILEAGMTLTVEPGIYVPGLGGVRLEDTLLITETGNERLTTLSKEFRRI